MWRRRLKVSGKKGQDYLLGIDFGTDSVRALVVDAADGSSAGTAVSAYKRWARGEFCDPRENRFRQHPLDYVEGIEEATTRALAEAGAGVAAKIRGIAIDTTGSTPCLGDETGTPLAMRSEFSAEPDAMFVLWKDHTAVAQAERINALARSWGGEDFTKYEGGIYSTEWFWSKVLKLVENKTKAASAARTIIEHCDWMPALLTGCKDLKSLKRSRCAAGHKAMWHASWGGYPPAAFLDKLNPRLSELAASLGTETYNTEEVFGKLSPEWAKRLGLSTEVVVCVGAFDAHIGAVGGDVAPGTLLKIMGTSTCDVMIGPSPSAGALGAPSAGALGAPSAGAHGAAGKEKLVAGICGQVDGSVVRGMIGYEAGQSAFGDVFAWFRKILAWPLRAGVGANGGAKGTEAAALELEDRLLPALEAEAAKIDPASSGLVALDWMNGRRTPDADQALTGAIAGINLGTDAPAVYRALVEAAAFGSRAIVERLRSEGVAIERVAAVGGVARKSPLVMQISADVLGMDISVSASDQSCALGGAMFAATAAGLYPDALSAQAAMRAPVERVYKPDAKRHAVYNRLYEKYRALGAFAQKEMRR
jgi:L-ribulokinase